MPPESTVREWVLDNRGGLAAQYARARELQAEHWADEILEIADDGAGDWHLGEKGERLVDHDHIQRSRLRVDTRKWLLAKLLPKKYGDKMMAEVERRGSLQIIFSQARGTGPFADKSALRARALPATTAPSAEDAALAAELVDDVLPGEPR
jgi:hypothetical protein